MTDVHTMRGMIVRGEVLAVHDDGAVQTLDVRTHDGVERTGIEVMQPSGSASNPAEGAEVLLFAVGGDQGDMVAMPPVHHGKRLGGLPSGTSGSYAADGTRVMAFPDGTVRIEAGVKLHASIGATEIIADDASITLTAGGVTLEVSAAGVQVTGKLVVSDSIADSKSTMQAMRDTYNGHKNPSNGNNPPDLKMT